MFSAADIDAVPLKEIEIASNATLTCFLIQLQQWAASASAVKILYLGNTILLKGTQVEFKDPNECHTFLKSSWWEDSDECGIEIFHRAPLEKKIF